MKRKRLLIVLLALALLVLLLLACELLPLKCWPGTHKCCPDSNKDGPLCHCVPDYTPCPPGQIDFGGEPPTPRP